MKSTSGWWSQGLVLRRSPSSVRSEVIDIARLVVFGALAVALHAATRRRLELGPGHQGLTWIALLMIGRLTSNRRWAGATAALGAAGATLLPIWALGDPFLWVEYLTAGTVVDVSYGTFSIWRDKSWVLAVLGGLAHATKPLLRFGIIGFSGWHYESLIAGLPYPLTTHFAFGALGALFGTALIRATRYGRSQNHR
jgi:hypothetical protein